MDKKTLHRGEMPAIYGVGSVGVKGQIVIPVKLRKDLDIKTDDNLVFLACAQHKGIMLFKTDDLAVWKNLIKELAVNFDKIQKAEIVENKK